MADNDDIQVQEDGTGELLDVRTVLIDGKHYPVFIGANGEGEIDVLSTQHLTLLHAIIDGQKELLTAMKINNQYLSFMNGFDLTSEDIGD